MTTRTLKTYPAPRPLQPEPTDRATRLGFYFFMGSLGLGLVYLIIELIRI